MAWYTQSASVPKGLVSNPAQASESMKLFLSFKLIDAELYKC
jgi:hypothetical protein